MPQVEYEQEPPAPVYADMTVGEILRKTREYYGQSLQYVEGVLRIRASQLEALEVGDLEALPGRVYAIGFVRSYSEYLGLDGDQMVQLFKQQTQGRTRDPELHFPVAASESKAPNFATIVGSLLMLIVVVGVWAIMQADKGPTSRDIPPVPEELQQSSITEAPAIGATPEEAELLAPKPELPPNRIIIEVADASWIEIKNAEGATLLRRVLQTGDQYLVPDEEGLSLSTGNAGGFKLRVDGEYLVSLGGKGDVRRDIALDPDMLVSGR